jgi:putative membrane protein
MTPPPSAQESQLRRFLKSWAINTLAVLVTVYIVPGIHFTDNSLLTPFVTSLVLGILNAFIRPIVMFLALPLLIVTLGLFMLVINALLLSLVDWLLPQFQIDSFGWALLGAIVISIVSLVLNVLTGAGRAQVTFRSHRRPPDDRQDGGSGPVIDV